MFSPYIGIPLFYIHCLISRSCESIAALNRENVNSLRELVLSSNMPKRSRFSSSKKSKKSRYSGDNSPSKRNSIPRSCKSGSVGRKSTVDFSFLSLPTTRVNLNMSTNLTKQSEKVKEVKKEMNDSSSASNDELDVVYDLQEEKKNKIYEVITVMSDDETPNQITYERIYAEDPEKRIVDESEVKELLSKAPPPKKSNINESDIVADIVKEANSIKEKNSSSRKMENETGIIKIDDSVVAINTDTKDDSDNEVICVAVLDSKRKAEEKRASVEEICLSSDSEPESLPKISPLRLKIPFSSYPYVNKYRYRPSNDSDNSFGSSYGFNSNYGSNNSSYSFGQMFNRPARIFPCISPKSNDGSDWESNSSHSKASSRVDSSPASSTSPMAGLAGEDSSSSALSGSSQHQNFSPRSVSSDSEKQSNPSSPSETSDEEKDIYWKANRQARRKESLRYEEFTDYGKKVHEGQIDVDVNSSLTFKVMSYNVLAQTLLEGHLYLYKNHDRRALSWAKRWALIYQEIRDENPEILCLQEVDTAHLATHYAQLLDLGYRWVYKKRTGKNNDGVAVFYKAAVFDAETHSQVEFYQPGVSVLDRDNVGVVLRLRLKSAPSQAVVVATTHLLYNPRRSDVRLAQVQLLLAEIDRLAFNRDTLTYYPVILTGDFNLKPLNGVYQLLTEGRLCYEGTSRKNLRASPEEGDNNLLPRTLLPWRLGITDRCQHVDVVEARARGEDSRVTRIYNSDQTRSGREPREHREPETMKDYSNDDRFESGSLSHEFQFQSVYTHYHSDGQLEASTHHDTWVTVDYIFYSSQQADGGDSLQLLSRLRLPTQHECDMFLRHLPNFAFGSDHLPLVAKFLLRWHPGRSHEEVASGNVSPRTPAQNSVSSGNASPRSPAQESVSGSEERTSPTPTSPPPPPTHKYSRQFLLTCAASPFSLRPPSHWDEVIKECPAIAKKLTNELNSRSPTHSSKQLRDMPFI